jgi:nicotinamidase/pyrazinamidase
MSNVLIIVDYQNDFLPGGALAAPEADDNLRKAIVAEAQMSDIDYIILSRDRHPPNHISFGANPKFEDMSWPTHCVEGTYGSQIEPMLWSELTRTGKPILVFDKGVKADIEAYSAFDGQVAESYGFDEDLIGKPLEHVLRVLDVDQVFVSGLVTEYCVAATALDSVHKKFYTKIYLEEIRGLNTISSTRILLKLAREGVVIV